MIRLFTYRDDDSGIVRYQKQPIESDNPVYVFVKLWEWEYYVGEDEAPAKYHCEIIVASPLFVSADKHAQCWESMGLSREVWSKLQWRDRAWLLAEYGIAATLFQKNGNNAKKLMKAARKELQAINVLFGFYLDKRQNAIGNSGWDFLRGELGL